MQSRPRQGQSCVEFVADVASRSSAPGGGAVAALAGALGSALCSMAGNFTIGKKRYADVEDDVKRLVKEANRLSDELLELVNADADAFVPLARAYGIPKDDPHRADTVEAATRNATKPPLAMMHAICATIDLLDEMEQKCSRMLLSDVGCAATLCFAALEAASLNVFVNTTALKDRAFAEHMETQADHMLSMYRNRAQRIAGSVTDTIRKG